MMSFRRLLEGWQRTATEASPSDSDDLGCYLSTLAIADPSGGSLRITQVGVPGGFAGVEATNALACAGVGPDVQSDGVEFPPTTRGALAALALRGPDDAMALIPGIVPERLRVDDVLGLVRRLATDVRDRTDKYRGLTVWREMSRSCADWKADAAALLWTARVIVVHIQGKPLASVAAWVREALDEEVDGEDHGVVVARRRAREALLDDVDRLAAHPETRLAMWEARARRIDELVDVPLSALGVELSRSVLVQPSQTSVEWPRIVERLVISEPVDAAEEVSVKDAASALACFGVAIPPQLESSISAKVAVEDARMLLLVRLRPALIALAHGDAEEAARAVAEPVADINDLPYVSRDITTVIGFLAGRVRWRSGLGFPEAALDLMVEQTDALCASDQLDEPTLLWIARILFHQLDLRSLGEVARLAHEWVWSAPSRLERARQEAPSHTPSFPIRRTLNRGAYVVEKCLKEGGHSGLYRGVHVATGARVFIAMDGHSTSRQSVPELRRAVRHHTPGLFELAHVGVFDDDHESHWAVVETVPDGDWLPYVLGPADPATAPKKAIQLGVAAGKILINAFTAGILLARIRPEFMWGRKTEAGYEVTGLTGRPIELFDRYRADAYTHALFERHYWAPEAEPTPNAAPDDRAVTFALAAMIAEWATGRFPLELLEGSRAMNPYGIRTSHPIEAPEPLRELLERALVLAQESRPALVDFVAELARLPIT